GRGGVMDGAGVLHIRSAVSEQDRAVVQALLQDGFEVRPGVGTAFARLYEQVVMQDARVISNGSRVALLGERIVGHTLLVPRFFYLDGVWVPGGIVAMVVVAQDVRAQGIGRALLQDVEALARKEGMMMLHLAGDIGYYRRLGYVEGYVQARGELEIQGSGLGALRPARKTDVQDLVRLAGHETPVGAVRPDAERWAWVLDTRYPADLLRVNDLLLGFCAGEDHCWVFEEAGEVQGYARACRGEGQWAIYEAGVLDDDRAEGMLEAMGGELGDGPLTLFLPPDNRVMQAVVRAGGKVNVQSDPELLVKLLDIPGVLNLLQPVLNRRLTGVNTLNGVALYMEQGGLVMDQDGVRLAKALEIESVEWKVSLPDMGWARAILGTDRLGDRVRDGGEVDRDVLELFDALFPEQTPYFWLADSL
ncbi:MAG: GNAT family N-acetyltransferase, partial [bacterium]|nr:GNAT family N-acetyltransferase [bacterium]